MTGVLVGNTQSVNVVQVTFDAGAVGSATTAEGTITVPGVKVGDFVSVSKADLDTGLAYGSARVSAADTVKVQLINTTP